jgi:NTP pyrophosphatase (non-canonical NTP hydrolase)
MILCTPCYNFEKVHGKSNVRYTTSLEPNEKCGRCGNGWKQERFDMGLDDEVSRITRFDEYQELSKETAQGYANTDDLPTKTAEQYTTLFLAVAINGEAGELGEKAKKYVREDDERYLEEAEAELGDILWYLAQMASLLDVDLSEVAERNLEKLLDRQERNAITGEGDYR